MVNRPSYAERFGSRLAELRERKGMNQTEFAGATGLSRMQLCNIENGTSKKVGLFTLIAFADELNCSLDDLVGRELS